MSCSSLALAGSRGVRVVLQVAPGEVVVEEEWVLEVEKEDMEWSREHTELVASQPLPASPGGTR